MVKSTMTETAPSSGRGGTAAAMAQNEHTTEEHSTLEQPSPGRLDHGRVIFAVFIFHIHIHIIINICK